MIKAVYVDTKEDLDAFFGSDFLVIHSNPFLQEVAKKRAQKSIDLFGFWSQKDVNDFSLECWRLSELIIKLTKERFKPGNMRDFSFSAEQDQSIYRFLHSVLFFQISFKKLLLTEKISSVEFKHHETEDVEANIHSVSNLLPKLTFSVLPALEQMGVKFKCDDVTTCQVKSELNDKPDTLISRLLVNGLNVSFLTFLLRSFGSLGLGPKKIIFTGLNESTSEELVKLFLKGKSISLINIKGLTNYYSSNPEGGSKLQASSITGSVFEISWADFPFLLKFLSPQLLQRNMQDLTRALDRYFNFLISVKVKSKAYLNAHIAANFSPPEVITNGLMGFIGEQVYSNLKSMGCCVHSFEHGVTVGLAKCNHVRGKSLESVNTDHFYVCSVAAKKENTNHVTKGYDWCHVIGLPRRVIEPNHPKLQRIFARRKLSIKKQEKVLMHIWGYYYFGNAPFLFQQLPNDQLKFEEELNREIYSKTPYRVFIKEYPSRRFFYQPTMQERYADLVAEKSVEFLGNADFRYVRMAADLIVTQCPTSTLGWVLGSGMPTIYLGSDEVKPLLNDSLRQMLANSLFYINVDEKNWADALSEILQFPYPDLLRSWEEKSDARDLLLRHYFGRGQERRGCFL